MTQKQGPRPGRETRSTESTNCVNDTYTDRQFWESRPILQHIYDFARARRVAPWATLGVVMARVVTSVPPAVMLPALVGGYGSLNLFIGLVGESGQGKGAATAAASDAVLIPSGVYRANVGSGEGLSHLFARRAKDVVERHRDSVLMDVHEVDTLTSLGTRNGSTTLPELRKAWSGETLGFSYADPTKRLDVQAHTYRFTMVCGIQPGRAAAILDDSDGGTPQRFVWLSTVDREAPDTAPKEPAPITWRFEVPIDNRLTGERLIMPICQEARETIDQQRLARLRGDGEAMAGHDLLAKLKIAAALAVLEGRMEVTSEDWELAEVLMRHSARTREQVQEHLKMAATEAGNKRAVAEGIRDSVREATKDERDQERVYSLICRHLPHLGESVDHRALKQKLPNRDRERWPAAFARLVREGVLQPDDEHHSYRSGVFPKSR